MLKKIKKKLKEPYFMEDLWCDYIRPAVMGLIGAAIGIAKVNHPNTKHYCENVWAVDPVKACEGHPVALAWFSPDCKHFSKAKGGKPKDKNIRGLAWVACRWAALVRPRVLMLENP